MCACEYDQLFGLGFLLVYIVVNNHILIIECVDEMTNTYWYFLGK